MNNIKKLLTNTPKEADTALIHKMLECYSDTGEVDKDLLHSFLKNQWDKKLKTKNCKTLNEAFLEFAGDGKCGRDWIKYVHINRSENRFEVSNSHRLLLYPIFRKKEVDQMYGSNNNFIDPKTNKGTNINKPYPKINFIHKDKKDIILQTAPNEFDYKLVYKAKTPVIIVNNVTYNYYYFNCFLNLKIYGAKLNKIIFNKEGVLFAYSDGAFGYMGKVNIEY